MFEKVVMLSGKSLEAPAKLKTVYMSRGEIVKTNSGKLLSEASLHAQKHLQRNSYGANYVEVLDADTEQLYYSATLKLVTRNGKPKLQFEGLYEWNPEDTERKYGASTLLTKANGRK